MRRSGVDLSGDEAPPTLPLYDRVMFLGHYAVALAAKRYAPRTSLGTLVLAAQLLDLLWPIFVLLGWEHVNIVPGLTAASPFDFVSYPISHSLLAAALWALLLACGYYFF